MATPKASDPKPVDLDKLNADAAKAGAAACRQSNGKARAEARLADAGADK